MLLSPLYQQELARRQLQLQVWALPLVPKVEGKFNSPVSSGKKDTRHLVFSKKHEQGVLGVWVKKANADEEPYLAHDYALFNNSPEL